MRPHGNRLPRHHGDGLIRSDNTITTQSSSSADLKGELESLPYHRETEAWAESDSSKVNIEPVAELGLTAKSAISQACILATEPHSLPAREPAQKGRSSIPRSARVPLTSAWKFFRSGIIPPPCLVERGMVPE